MREVAELLAIITDGSGENEMCCVRNFGEDRPHGRIYLQALRVLFTANGSTYNGVENNVVN
jgi:hypothetical protein